MLRGETKTSGKVKKTKVKKWFASCWSCLLVFILLVLNVGCSASVQDVGGRLNKSSDQVSPAESPAAEYFTAGEAGASVDASFVLASLEKTGQDPGAGAAGAGAGQEKKRYVILHARLTLEIEDLEAAAGEIQEQVKALGGYLVSLEFYDLRDERRAGHIAVRVPENKFDFFLDSLEGQGKVKNPHVYTDDVTMHYIDLEARLKNLAAQEERMRELLERAKTVEEILQIERELGRIRGDLEAMTAEFKHLQEQVNYSSVEIRLEEKDPRMVTVTGGFGSFGEKIGHLLALNTSRLLKGFSTFLVVAIGSLPLLLPLFVLAFLGWKTALFLRTRKKKSINHRDNLPS